MKWPRYFKRLIKSVRIAWTHRKIIERQNRLIAIQQGNAANKCVQHVQQLEVIDAFYKRGKAAENRMFILTAQLKRSLEGRN